MTSTNYKTTDYLEELNDFLQVSRETRYLGDPIANTITIHPLPKGELPKLVEISDTRAMFREQFAKEGKTDFFNEIHDNSMELMKDSCKATIIKSLLYVIEQGDRDADPEQLDGLTKLVEVVPTDFHYPNLSRAFSLSGRNVVKSPSEDGKTGYAIVSNDDDFGGIEVYGDVSFMEVSPDMFSIKFKGYFNFSKQLIDKLRIYKYVV